MDINVFMNCVQGHNYHILRRKPVSNNNKILLILEALILANQHLLNLRPILITAGTLGQIYTSRNGNERKLLRRIQKNQAEIIVSKI